MCGFWWRCGYLHSKHNQGNVLGGFSLLKLSFAELRNLPQMVTQADLNSA